MTDALGGLLAVAAGAPEIDLDVTVVFQLLLFGLAYVVLHNMMFKPYLAANRERLSRTTGEREKADDAAKRASALLTEYEAKIAEAREDAMELRTSLVGKARGEADTKLGEAREWSNGHVEKSRVALESDLTAARADVRPRAEALSDAIKAKILA